MRLVSTVGGLGLCRPLVVVRMAGLRAVRSARAVGIASSGFACVERALRERHSTTLFREALSSLRDHE